MSDRSAQASVWLVPLVGGALLILVGLVLFIWPELLAFTIASVFVVAGISLIASARRWRGGVVYRRIEDPWRDPM